MGKLKHGCGQMATTQNVMAWPLLPLGCGGCERSRFSKPWISEGACYSAALSIDVSNYVSYNCRTPPEWRGPSGGMRRRIPPSVSPELREVGGVALCTGAQRKEIPVAGAACKLASHSMCLITED